MNPALAKPDPMGPRLRRAPARLLVSVVRLYQRTLSPLLPVVTMGGCACRFAPTCSQYAIEAITAHGAMRGAWLAGRRLIKCTPLHPGGCDPVPPANPARVCRRSAPGRVADQRTTWSATGA